MPNNQKMGEVLRVRLTTRPPSKTPGKASPKSVCVRAAVGLLTPSSLHYGQGEGIIASRKQTLYDAWQKTPERFVGGVPEPTGLPKAVWINAPKQEREMKNEAPETHCPGAP